MKTTGERIRQARLYRGLSAEELARRVGYATQSAITNLENRTTGRGGFKLAQIAQALDVSVQWLLNGPDTLDIAHIPPFDGMTGQGESCTGIPGSPPWLAGGWPFRRIGPADWARLTRAERDMLEKQILGLLLPHD